jgi:ribosomal protein S18 acetylase RimI-like enzyme
MAGPVPPAPGEAVIVPFRPSHAGAFYFLNRSWLDTHGLYERVDERNLADPHGTILEKGGAVFVAEAGDAVVGTAAIIPREAGEAELTKLTVVPDRRGRGLGRRLAGCCLEFAREIGVRRVVLITHSRLDAAIRLYESLGFVRRPMLADHAQALADTCMEWQLPA